MKELEFATGDDLTRKAWAKRLWMEPDTTSLADVFGLVPLPPPTRSEKAIYHVKEIGRRIKSAYNALRGRECDCLS